MKQVLFDCEEEIDWNLSGPITMEKGWKERRVKESIETFKSEVEGKQVLNQCDALHQSWKNVMVMKK